MNMHQVQAACLEYLEKNLESDPAHDISHVRRVVNNTLYLTDIEKANSKVSVPAAWLHDCISVPKNSPQRSQASRLAAAEAVRFLAGIGYPEQLLGEIHHAIEAHSFSAAVRPRSLEARIVQDADRLEALGAIGIARCLLTGGNMGTPLYDPDDPFCDARDPDDRKYTLDHFYTKLFKLPGTMQTRAGRAEANRRVDYMRDFLAELAGEIANSRFNPRN
jgi:uncharacterized protein